MGEEVITWFVYNITFPPLVSMETVSKSNMMLLGKFISHFLESAAVILLGSFT